MKAQTPGQKIWNEEETVAQQETLTEWQRLAGRLWGGPVVTDLTNHPGGEATEDSRVQ